MKRLAASLLLLLCSTPYVVAQEIQLGEPRTSSVKNHVVLVSDSLEVAAGKQETVELRFRVDPGFHINSHEPKDELLIPTSLKFDTGSVKVLAATFQHGTPFRLQVGAGQTLDVYQGEFRVTVRLLAPKGSSTLIGSLRYQACDNAACFPPKTLPLNLSVTGR